MDATLTIVEDRPATFTRLWARLVSFVATPGDDDEALRKKRLLLVVVLAKAPVCPSLAIAYYTLGVPLAALVPVVYQVLTVASVIAFLVTRNFDRFRFQQTLLIFLGPIALALLSRRLRQLERGDPLVLPGAAHRHPLPRRAPVLALVRGAVDRPAGPGRRRFHAGGPGAHHPGLRARRVLSVSDRRRSARSPTPPSATTHRCSTPRRPSRSRSTSVSG